MDHAVDSLAERILDTFGETSAAGTTAAGIAAASGSCWRTA